MPKPSTTNPTAQRRGSLRVHLESPLPVSISGDRRGSGLVRDLALGGAFLTTDVQLELGASLQVKISWGAEAFESGAIVRNVKSDGMGVEFVGITPENRKLLRQLISRLLA